MASPPPVGVLGPSPGDGDAGGGAVSSAPAFGLSVLSVGFGGAGSAPGGAGEPPMGTHLGGG